MTMLAYRRLIPALALFAVIGWSGAVVAQEPGQSKDEALDSLLKKLDKPEQEKRPAKEGKSETKPEKPPAKAKAEAPAKTKSTAPDQTAKPRPKENAEVSAKDKEIDDLLEKLGETKDQPARDERPPGRPQEGQPGQPPKPGGGGGDKPKDKDKAPDLQKQDKEIDEKLEELAGRKKRRKPREQEDGSGPLGQIIKEMRDVEHRLGKPETGEDTQSKQKKIVKEIETLIERMRQAGGSGSMALRMVRQAGQRPGNQQGQTPGATAGGAPNQKPAKPSEHHAIAGGKDIWGHLPAELRQEMENVFKEEPLSAKMDLIRRYYLSVAKQQTRREE
jgi:hypothetical protein